MRNRIIFIIYILLLFVMLEIVLRIQQKLGPVYDLDFSRITFGSLSDILNHRNLSGESQYSVALGNKKIKFKRYFDCNGIRINKLRPQYTNDQATFKVLFMGDSFMEGYDDEHTIPQYIWQNFQCTHMRNRKINFLNASCESYSATIYIVQAKLLIPLLRPNFVVIDIDETDIMDDYIRYRDLIVRDNTGNIIAVRHSPTNYMFLAGFIKMKKYPLYVARLFLKFYHTKIFMPLTIRSYYGKYRRYPHAVLSHLFDCDNNAIKKYRVEIDYFKKILTELVRTLINLMKDKRKILFIYHSHLLHLKGDTKGFYGNNFTADILKEVLDEYQISFYDATEDLKKFFKDEPEKYYIPRDPFAHFNFEGTAIYSNSVTRRLLPMIEVLINEKS